MGEKVRTFIALPLPQTVLDPIRDVQERLKKERFSVRWVRPESIHLTLKFLGDIAEGELEGVSEAMKAVAAQNGPCSICAKGLGVFPGVKNPRVLWVGVAGDTEPLGKIQSDLESQLESKGYPREKRPFKSHLTIGRAKGRIDSRGLAEVLREHSDLSSPPFEAGELVLFKSDLKPSGAVYTRLATEPLVGIL